MAESGVWVCRVQNDALRSHQSVNNKSPACHSLLCRYIRSERSIILVNFCLSILASNLLILVGQSQTLSKVSRCAWTVEMIFFPRTSKAGPNGETLPVDLWVRSQHSSFRLLLYNGWKQKCQKNRRSLQADEVQAAEFWKQRANVLAHTALSPLD